MMSFISACLCCRPPTFLHDKLCSPRPSTIPPHTHRCGSQIFKPSLSPVATLISSSDKRSPIAAMGEACNQSPEYYFYYVVVIARHVFHMMKNSMCVVRIGATFLLTT